MKKLALSVLLSTGIVSSSFAVPLIDAKAGIGYVFLSPSGYVQYGDNTNSTEADVEKDLNLGNSNKVNAYFQIGLPVLPTIKVEYLPTQFKGTGDIKAGFNFGGINITANDRATTDINLTQWDVSFFYGLPLPFITPRAGLAVKVLDGYIDIRTLATQQHERVNLTVPIPMLYAGANISLPVIPVEIDGEGKFITYSGHYILDAKLTGKFTLVGLPLIGKAYIGGGYRYQQIKLKDLDIDGKKLNTDVKFKGPFVEVGVEF